VNQDTITPPEFWAGTYDIQMIITSFLGCVDSLTFTEALEVKPQPTASFQHSPNPVQMFNTNVIFTSTSTLADQYEWYFESGFPPTSTQETAITSFPDGVVGTYNVILMVESELGCRDTVDYDLVVFPEVLIYAPNSFTPDEDEFNQGWRVYMEGIDVQDFELLIFNRWGELIWQSHDIEVEWDGTYGGVKLPIGTYTWRITTKDILNDGKFTYTGHVNIIK
jgi:gliding motility-associated-like protein